MASRVSDAALNIAADAVTSQAITVRLHDGAPGDAGTGNRIGTVSQTVAAGGWTAASGGISETAADVVFGVLSTTQSHTVTAYSLWRGNTFLGWADLQANVAVAANEAFTITAGTIEFRFARPA